MTEHGERRKALEGNRWGFDKQINLASVTGTALLLIALVGYGSRIVNYLQAVDSKVTVMWQQFIEDHPDKAQQYNYLFKWP